MNGVDFIIFILTLVMLFIIFLRRSAQERAARARPQNEKEIAEDEEAFQEHLRAMGIEIEEEKRRPPPPPTIHRTPPTPPKPKPKPIRKTASPHQLPQTPFSHIPRLEKKPMGVFKEIDSKVEKEHITPNLKEITHIEKMKGEQRQAYAKKKTQYSRTTLLLRSMKNPADMMIMHEILQPPKALRPPN